MREVESFHLEMLDEDQCWIGVNLLDGRHLRIILTATIRGKLEVTVEVEGKHLG